MTAIELKKFREEHNLTQDALASVVGKKLRTVQSWEQGERQVPQTAVLLLQNYSEFPTKNEVKEKHYPAAIPVKLVTTKARAGYVDSFYADEYLKDMPTVLVEADQEYKGEYLAFEVDGDSMEPDYYAGDVVICREVKRHLWQYKLHFHDYDFVIAHGTKGIFLKEIIEHDVEKKTIKCHSLNQEGVKNQDFTLNLGEVAHLYNVVEHRTKGKSKKYRR